MLENVRRYPLTFFHLTIDASGSPKLTVQCAVFLKAGLGCAVVTTVPRLPFVLSGRDPSVVLELLKRGYLDVGGKVGPRTIVLRLYDAFFLGGARFGQLADQLG